MSAEHLQQIEGKIDALAASTELEFRAIQETFATMRSYVEEGVGTLRHETKARFDAIDNRFDAIDKRFGEVDKRLDAIDARFVEVDKRFDAIDARFVEVDKRFDAVDARFDRLEAKLDRVLMTRPRRSRPRRGR